MDAFWCISPHPAINFFLLDTDEKGSSKKFKHFSSFQVSVVVTLKMQFVVMVFWCVVMLTHAGFAAAAATATSGAGSWKYKKDNW